MPQTIPEALAKPFSSGEIPAAAVGSTLDQMAQQSAQNAVASGVVPPQYVQAYANQMRQRLGTHESGLEDAAHRAGGMVDASVTPEELAMKGVTYVGIPWLGGQAIHYANRAIRAGGVSGAAERLQQTGLTPGAQRRLQAQYAAQGMSPAAAADAMKLHANPNRYSPERAKNIAARAAEQGRIPRMTLGGAAKMMLLPSLPYTALREGMGLLRPLSDPKYQRGERGYVNSWWEGKLGDVEQLDQKVQETRDRYGRVLGAPVQLLHGMLNPVTSLMSGAKSIKNLFAGEQAAPRVAAADAAVGRTLGQA
jgi:hypothetical protein